jgi:hypothetical protein
MNIIEQITTLVKEMSLSELQDTVLRLVEKDPNVRGALHQVWKEQERAKTLQKSVKWTATDWLEAKIHYEPIIQAELSTCAGSFVDRYEYGYADYDSDEGRFDFTEGLDQLNQWFAELLEMAADGQWIDASVGLLLTLQKLDDWAIENGDEEIDGDDLRDECVSFWNKAKEFTAVIRNSTAPDPNKSAFFLELMDWIVGLSEKDEEWSIWKETLSSCLFSSEHYERLKEHLQLLEPNLFACDTDTAKEPDEADVVRWWVQASLDSDQETEAKRAETRLAAFDIETSACFVHYYERLNQTEEAITRLQFILQHIQEQIQRKSSEPFGTMYSDYPSEQQINRFFEWLITLYERTERQTEAEAWRVRWFETLPSLELFKLCLAAVALEERDCQAEKWIAHVRRQKKHRFSDLLIDIYLYLNDPDGAWFVYKEESPPMSDWISESMRRLFEKIKQHDPLRLVPVLRQFAEKRIAEKNRRSYQRAVEWLAELKSVYNLINQSEAWTSYFQSLKENYSRLPALKDEIAKAKL